MRIAIFVAALWAAGPALADDRALIFGNENYRDAADISAASDALGAVRVLEAAGFRVFSGGDLGTGEMRKLMAGVLEDRAATERLVIVLSGHFARSERGTWFLGTEASVPDLATVDGVALSLATVLEVASGAPGGAVVLLGSEERRLPLGEGLAPGIGDLDVPQGVTVVRGDAARIAAFATRDLPRRGVSLSGLLALQPELRAEGFLSSLVPFRPLSAVVPAQPSTIDGADEAVWENARLLDTAEAYDAYLRRFPVGKHAAEAKAAADKIRAEPYRDARLAETALALTSEERREIQRALSLLGYDPRGIDGVFGPGSRRAIARWQTAEVYAPSGYLDRAQIKRLLRMAADRAAELEREAQARQAEQERQDRTYWDQTGAAGDEAGLRAYLGRFPDGLYADVAEARLAVFEDQRRGEAEVRDRAAWDRAASRNEITAYEDYLSEFPNGAFAEEAKRRIVALQPPQDTEAERAAKADEAALGLNAATRRMIEGRLAAMGLKPGTVDGVFDEQTRRAIRRYQKARDLPATGYMTEATVVRLLADTVRGIGN